MEDLDTLLARYSRRGSVPDLPSAEPFRDLIAQARDTADADNPRRGLYLSQPNLAAVMADRQVMQALSAALGSNAVPLPDFDGRGGMLVVDGEHTAKSVLAARQRALAHRDDVDRDLAMQRILGSVTGAGHGKPETGVIVQQVAPGDAVTREGIVPHHDVTDAVDEFAYPGRAVRVVDPMQAILRRSEPAQQSVDGLLRQYLAAQTGS